jgi:hypothetical protein
VHKLLIAIAALAALLTLPNAAFAQRNTLAGAGAGAVAGAIVGGPIGAAVGGIGGAYIGATYGPRRRVVRPRAAHRRPPRHVAR